MLATLGVAGVFASGIAVAVTMLLGTGLDAGMTAGGLTLLTIGATLLPMTLPNPTVPSKFGNAVLGGTMLQTMAVLGLGFLVTLTTDFDRRGFLLGMIAGGVVLLSTQVWFGISVLKRAQASAVSTDGKDS